MEVRVKLETASDVFLQTVGLADLRRLEGFGGRSAQCTHELSLVKSLVCSSSLAALSGVRHCGSFFRPGGLSVVLLRYVSKSFAERPRVICHSRARGQGALDD